MALERWVIQPGQTRVIDIEIVRALKVSLIGGRVDVIGHDDPGARIEVSAVSGKDIRIEIDGDRLSIDHPQLRWDNWIETFKGFTSHARAVVSVLVPRDVALKLGVVSAEALVSGFATDARLSTVSGDIVADRITGDIDLNTVNGELSVSNHVGRVRVNAVSGDVTASGAITRFSADGVSGDMILDSSVVTGVIDTNTVSGNLTVRLPRGDGARYRLNTVSGSIHLDDRTIKGTLGKGFEQIDGELAGDWLDLGANSVSGDVTVVRRDSAPADAARTGAEAS